MRGTVTRSGTSEAALLSEVASEVLARHPPGDDPWTPLVDGGWIGVGVEEARGGSGGGIAEAVALAEALGATCAPVPLLEAVLATQLAARTGDSEGLIARMASGELRATVVPGVLRVGRERGGYLLSGEGWVIPWASRADVILAVASTADGLRLLALPRTRVQLDQGANLAGEPRDRLTPVDRVVAPADAHLLDATLDDLLDVTAVLCAARLVGALAGAHRLSLDYARNRQQFGRPIGSFQAIAHALVRQVGDVELSSAALRAALENTDGPSASESAATARVIAGSVAADVARVAHQIHGAIGVTDEHELRRFTLRLQAWRQEYGPTSWWQRRLGREVIDAGPAWWDRAKPEVSSAS